MSQTLQRHSFAAKTTTTLTARKSRRKLIEEPLPVQRPVYADRLSKRCIVAFDFFRVDFGKCVRRAKLPNPSANPNLTPTNSNPYT